MLPSDLVLEMLDGNALLSAEELAVGPCDDLTLHYRGSVRIQLEFNTMQVNLHHIELNTKLLCIFSV